MKKTYKKPALLIQNIDSENLFASSVSSNIGDIGFGGNASDNDIYEADGNSNMWDMW